VQFNASRVDIKFEKLRVPRTWKGVLFVGRASGYGAVQEMKVWPFAAALAEGGGKPPHAALAEDLVNMSGGGAWCAWPLVLYEEMEEFSGPPESPCGRRLQTTYRGLG
jgi:hypothetical protein